MIWKSLESCQIIKHFKVWEILKQNVYKGQREKFNERDLKEKVQKVWDAMDLNSIRESIKSWKKRLRLVINENGGPIDHKLK